MQVFYHITLIINYKLLQVYFKNKINTWWQAQVGDGAGTQEEDDSLVLGLRQQCGYNEEKYKHKRRNSLEGGPHASFRHVCSNT